MTRYELYKILSKQGKPFDVSIEEGWIDIISRLHEDLLTISPNYTLAQVKEKFAGLRYYADPEPNLSDEQYELFRNRIGQAEKESEETCQNCGKPGVEKAHGSWWFTQCEDCYNKFEEQRKNGK